MDALRFAKESSLPTERDAYVRTFRLQFRLRESDENKL